MLKKETNKANNQADKILNPFTQRFRSLFMQDETQDQFGKRTGINRNTVAQYFNGKKTSPNAKIIEKLCKSCNVSADWLLGLTPADVRKPDPTLQAACEYTGLSEKAIENIHEITLGESDMEGYYVGIGIYGIKLDDILSLDVKLLTHMLHMVWLAQMDMEDHRKLANAKPGDEAYELSVKQDKRKADGRKERSPYHSAKDDIQDVADTLFTLLCEKPAKNYIV